MAGHIARHVDPSFNWLLMQIVSKKNIRQHATFNRKSPQIGTLRKSIMYVCYSNSCSRLNHCKSPSTIQSNIWVVFAIHAWSSYLFVWFMLNWPSTQCCSVTRDFFLRHLVKQIACDNYNPPFLVRSIPRFANKISCCYAAVVSKLQQP